jgi:hypothetical protein
MFFDPVKVGGARCLNPAETAETISSVAQPTMPKLGFYTA